MPTKTVREMSELERKHYSLSARVFHASLMGSVLLGLIALAVGLGLYTVALTNQYISEAFNLSRSTETILKRVVYLEPLTERVMELYNSMDDTERTVDQNTESYQGRFREIAQMPEFQTIIAVLETFKEASDVNDIYLGMYDGERNALVYIADPETDENFICRPGSWEEVEARECQKFLNWDGVGKLYDISKTEKYGWMCTAGVPVRNEEGELLAFILADITLEEVSRGMKSFLLQFTLAIFAVTILVAYFLTRHMKKTLVKPINEIAQAAQDYVHDKRNGAPVADHFSMLNIRTGDEVENLAAVMADMERDLTEYEDDLTRMTAEKERINTELDLARRIQADMLPNIFPPFPDRDDFSIYASMDPAKEVGGDFYDFFLLDEQHLALVIADVSGKGVPAALFMMGSKILIKNHAMAGNSPGEVLRRVNEQICRHNREEMFVTVWLGILDLETGVLTASNAGHEYPVFTKPDGEYELYKDRHGFVIGGMENVRFKEYSLKLEPGARLFLYTDGVTEATNRSNELFGIERTIRALNEVKDADPETVLKTVEQRVALFVGSADQFDDMTMLCVEYRGKNKQ